MPNTDDQSTSAVRRDPPETVCPPGFNQPDTLDWSSLFTQIKNQLILIPSPASPRWTVLPPREDVRAPEKGHASVNVLERFSRTLPTLTIGSEQSTTASV